MKEVGEYRYKLRTNDGKVKSITMKEIYRRLYDDVFCKDEIERLDGEVFVEIDGTNGNYLISNYGRCLSYSNNHAIILKPTITENGYERLQIIIDGKRYNKLVHCLVAKMWLGSPKNLEQEIHHKDFDKNNNKADNLQYVDRMEHIKKHNERRKNA